MKGEDLYYRDESKQLDPMIKGQQFDRGDPGRNPQPPRSAPPNFNPTMPGDMPASFSGDSVTAEPFGRNNRGQSTNIRRCLNQFTFIWLINGNSFWFYPVAVRGQQVEGFRWRQGRWEYDWIPIRRILFFHCF